MIEPASIGIASVADAEAIAALHAASFDGGWDAFAIARLVRDRTAICRVARSGSGLAGFALCRVAADECEVLSCAVDASFRRQGAARLLLRACFDEAARRGARAIFLEVAADSASARALYVAIGFQIVGRRPSYYLRALDEPVDALIMRRGL